MESEMSFDKQKKRLRMLYKYYKVGKFNLVEATVTKKERELLKKYYCIEV